MRALAPALALAALAAPPVSPVLGASHWTLEASLGGALNLSAPVTIRQQGSPDLRFHARPASRGAEFPLYYVVRVARWSDERAWMAELRHHKLFLEDPPAEVGEFSISHGYNLLTVGRLQRARGLVLGLVAGVVIAHPENVVRGRPLEEGRGIFGLGYHVAGPTGGALAAREIPLGARWAIPIEAMVSASWARVPVSGGNADVPNFALHGTIGVSRRLPRAGATTGDGSGVRGIPRTLVKTRRTWRPSPPARGAAHHMRTTNRPRITRPPAWIR